MIFWQNLNEYASHEDSVEQHALLILWGIEMGRSIVKTDVKEALDVGKEYSDNHFNKIKNSLLKLSNNTQDMSKSVDIFVKNSTKMMTEISHNSKIEKSKSMVAIPNPLRSMKSDQLSGSHKNIHRSYIKDNHNIVIDLYDRRANIQSLVEKYKV